jgi:LAGLIDADG endonuclease
MDLNSYISGFVDGEGCFYVSFQPSTRHRFGWEVRPSFSVSQNADRAELLYMIQEKWECGFIRPDRSDKTLKFEIRNVSELVATVLPHFSTYPLLSSKKLILKDSQESVSQLLTVNISSVKVSKRLFG